ncbi:MAG: IS21 family transposase [Firmicutes bacterium]|nr:IS21 family transposase [Bacillota bacterium]
MIDVVDKEMIRRLYYLEGKTIRWISRELGYARQTIRKALEDAAPPEYQLSRPRPQPVTGHIRPIVAQWVAEEETKKHRLTGEHIYERLVEEYGYTGSPSTIRRLVGELRRNSKETFVPLEFRSGSNAQCDWGEDVAILGGLETLVQFFCLRLSFSRMPFVMAFPHQRQEAFFEGHTQGFIFLGGVPHSITYDNLKTAVYKVLLGRNRIEQNNFIAFRSHHLFESRYCNIGRGNEKGGVENLVGFAHRNFFTPTPEAGDWDELNALLLKRCLNYAKTHRVPNAKVTVFQAWETEKEHLLPLPSRPFPCCRYVEAKAAQNQLVRFENNYYSVPASCAGRSLVLKAYVHRVEIYSGRLLVAAHRRSYCTGEEVYDLDHYLEALYRKPRALEDAKPFHHAKLPSVYHRYLAALKEQHLRPEREFVQILLYHREVGWDVLTAALEKALAQKIYHVAGVKDILWQLTGKCLSPVNLEEQQALSAYQVPRPDLKQFGLLVGRAGRVVH